jgi:4-hydroxybenzoate polyprenyltransferase
LTRSHISIIYTTKTSDDFSTKFIHLKRLIRAESILPTSLLCFTGGFMMNPSIIGLLQTPKFLVSTLNTIFIMSSSMIVNDIFDINLDKIDHPDRPLVNGCISRNTAIIYFLGFLSTVEFLNVRFLPDNLQTIFHLAIINILLYTPIYKKIPFVKNIFCATMIAFSIFVSGLSATKELMVVNPGFSILSIALSVVFFGSWYNEVLLDITDYEGDRQNGIYTVPVLFGKKNAWRFASFLLFFNILFNTLSLSYLYGRGVGFILPLIFSPMVYDCLSISNTKHAVNNTRKSLFLFVLFLCGLSLFRSGFTISFPKDIHWLHIATTIFM